MRVTTLSLGLFLLSVGCGLTAGPRSAPLLARGDTRWETCFPGRYYTDAEIALMLRMRDDGAGRADVAKRIGGTLQEIRCAEARARGRLRSEELQVATTSKR